MEDETQMVRCSVKSRNWCCKVVFKQDYRDVKGVKKPFRMCPMHRAKACAAAKTPTGKANRARNSKTTKGAASRAEYRRGGKRKAVLKKHNASEKRKASGKRYRATDKGRSNAAQGYARWYAKLMKDGARKVAHNIRKKISKVLRTGESSLTLLGVSSMTPGEWRAHFEAHWTEGMSWENYGDKDGCWHVGHRIPVVAFDPENEADQQRCWDARNVFPQWRTENHQQHTALPPRDELLQMADMFPEAWRGCVPSERAC